MREIYASDSIYPYVDIVSESNQEVFTARNFFKNNNLELCPLLNYAHNTLLFTWAGDKINRTIALASKLLLNKEVGSNYLYITGIDDADVTDLLSFPKPRAEELADLLNRPLKEKQKYDQFLSDDLLNLEYASSYLDVEGAWKELNKIYSRIN